MSKQRREYQNTVLFAKLTKVDESKREVYGVLAEEAVDKTGQVFDYASSKKYFKAWSDAFEKVTGGKSKGNVRLMHQPIAVGKLIAIEFRDDEKQIYIGAKVTDDDAWKMVQDGVLTGFSIGGVYIDIWEVGKNEHYTCAPAEASLVDNPCMYGTTFEVVRATGAVDLIKFVGGAPQVKVDKGMWEVADMAQILAMLNSVRARVTYEEAVEGDGSPIGGELKDSIDSLADILVRMLKEEAAELTADMEETELMEMAASIKDLSKVATPDKVQKLLDLAEGLEKLARSESQESNQEQDEMENQKTFEEIQKAFDKKVEDLSKANDAKLTTLAEGQLKLAESVDATNKTVSGIADVMKQIAEKMAGTTPSAPVRLAVHSVSKTEDANKGTGTETPALRVKGRDITKIATPELEAEGREASFEAILKIHQTGGIAVRPGDSRFMVTAGR